MALEERCSADVERSGERSEERPAVDSVPVPPPVDPAVLPAESPRSDSPGFDRMTRVLFRIPAMGGYFMYTLGPAVVILRDEYGVSRAVASLHGSMSALGGIIAAMVVVRLIALAGRRRVVMSAVGVSAVGIGLLVFGHGIAFSLTGAFLCAVAGSVSINSMTAILTLHHGRRGSAMLTQAHAVLASMGLIAPLMLGMFVAIGWGWRPAFAGVWVLGALIVIGLARLPHNAELDGHGAAGKGRKAAPRRPFQKGFWLLYLALILTAAAEHATLYWAADLIFTRLGTPIAVASTTVSAFVGGIFVGRLITGRMAERLPPLMLVTWSVPISVLGWTLLWLAPVLAVAFIGMALIGLGIACCFPMLVAMMSGRSDGQPDRSIALAGLGAGLATGVAPFILAAVSDQIGPVLGFLLVPLYLLGGFGLLLWCTIADRRRARAAAG
jgi:predicted MFS family arabinose efflux permease